MSGDSGQDGQRIRELVNNLLDRGYEQAARQTLEAIARNSTSGIVAQRLDELMAEAARLVEAGERLRPDNAVLRALLADLDEALVENARLVGNAAGGVQDAGVRAGSEIARQMTLPGINAEALRLVGVRWNVPDPEAINRAVGYVNNPAWGAELRRYPSLVLGTVRNQALRGIAEGWNPRRTAEAIVDMTEGLPAHVANNLMRTLHLTSMRRATDATYITNADIISHKIRVATLDGRVCMSCVALHGTVLRLDEEVLDHHSGRCVGVGVIRGRTREIVTGEVWFAAQPEARQRQQMGPAAFEAWQAGRVQLRDFVHRYDDEVFGPMLREASLRDMLGDAAREYYRR